MQSKGLSRVFFNTTDEKGSILLRSAFFTVQLSHPHVTTGKTTALIYFITIITFIIKHLFNRKLEIKVNANFRYIN